MKNRNTGVRWAALIALLALAVAPAISQAQTEPKPADPAITGIKVGENAPDFTLKDQNGEEHSLSGMLEEGPVALIFSRSAQW